MNDKPDSPEDGTRSQFRLARATLEDFDAVAALFGQLHSYNAALDACFALHEDWRPLFSDYFLRTWADQQWLWLLAWQGTQPVGLLVLREHLDSPLFRYRRWVELVAIYVVPSVRGAGLAALLIDTARAWTHEHGCTRLQLYVTASNRRARAFYSRYGLHPVQEIWRLDMAGESAAASGDELAPDDLPSTGAYQADDWLEPGHHSLDGSDQQPG